MGKPIGTQSVGMILLKVLGWFMLVSVGLLALAFLIWALTL